MLNGLFKPEMSGMEPVYSSLLGKVTQWTLLRDDVLLTGDREGIDIESTELAAVCAHAFELALDARQRGAQIAELQRRAFRLQADIALRRRASSATGDFAAIHP